MKLIHLIALLPITFAQDNSDLTASASDTQASAAREQTSGKIIAMTADHPARGTKLVKGSNDPNAPANTIHVLENTDSISSGSKMGTILFEKYSSGKFEKTLKNLPVSGISNPIPWPSEYWPSYQDGINVRTNPGQQTAVEKYAQAFNLNAKSISDEISKKSGVDAWTQNPKCQSDDDCAASNDQSKCAIRELS